MENGLDGRAVLGTATGPTRRGRREFQRRQASDVASAVHMYRIGERFDVTVLRKGRPRTVTMKMIP